CADAIARCAQPNDFICVHDYHLMYVAQALRERGVSQKLSGLTFFLHIPFPPYDIFSKLPQQQRLLRALLQFDLVGFQTRRDVRNSIQCVRRVMSEAKSISRGELQLIRFEDHEIRVGYFPIGIDFDSFEKSARSDSVEQRAQRLRATFPGCQLILGSDRLDYSKGIPERLRASRTALERYPELSGRVVLIQIVVPSRVEIPRYHEFKQRIDRLVGDINGRFSTSTWPPVQYHLRFLDLEDLADTILKAFRMRQVERSGRMKRMRHVVRKENVFWWVDSFLRAGLQIGTRPPRVSKRRLATSAR